MLTIKIDVFHHFDPVGAPGAPGIVDVLAKLEEVKMALIDKINTVLAEAQETRTVVDSALVALQGMRDTLAAVQAGEATLDEAIATFDQVQADLANAIAANTPGAPPSEEPGEPQG